MNKKKKIFLVAGEASGDALGGLIIRSLKARFPDLDLEFIGVGGGKMKEAGMDVLYSNDVLSVMGFIEIIPQIPRIFAFMRKVIAKIEELKPDMILTIDSPGFNFRLIRRLREKSIFGFRPKIVHCIAPTVWAYNPERAYTVSKLYDHILLALPFESRYFSHMPHTFIGHYIADDELDIEYSAKKRADVRDYLSLGAQDMLMTVMPGSRKLEIKHHLCILCRAIQTLQKAHQDRKMAVFIPTIEPLKEHIIAALKSLHFNDVNYILSSDHIEKQNFIIASDVALVKSGTAVLEVMKATAPIIAFYKMSSITAWILKKKLKVRHVTLPNILLEKEVIPELLQENFTVNNVLSHIQKCLFDKDIRDDQSKHFSLIRKMLKAQEDMKCPDIAAEAIINILYKN